MSRGLEELREWTPWKAEEKVQGDRGVDTKAPGQECVQCSRKNKETSEAGAECLHLQEDR